ncbi:MAG: helix-turn-helix domain-containing protein [Fimbriiglobus sp.]
MNAVYLTVREVASMWGVSRSIVYALVAHGLLPSVRVGVGRGTIRIREGVAAEYLKKHDRDDVKTSAEHFA